MLKKIKRRDYMKNLRKRLEDLAGREVFIGFDETNGMHKSYEDSTEISFPNLAYILFTGSSKINLPARNVYEKGLFANPVKKNKILKRDLKKYFSNINRKRPSISATTILENVGGDYVQTFRGIFGSSQLTKLQDATVAQKERRGAKSTTAPLLANHSLRDSMMFRIDGGAPITPSTV